MAEVTVYAETEVYPTEDVEKVKAAVDKVLGNAAITVTPAQNGSTLKAQAAGKDTLIKLRTILRQDRVRDAARKLFFKSTRGNKITFYLNKQVAYAGHVSFSEETAESPLGPIKFTIETDEPERLVEWLAEKT
jgi:uncharacterized protein